MNIIEVVKLAIDQGGLLALSIVVIYWNRKDSKATAARERQYLERERDDKLLLMEALQENTKAITELNTRLRQVNGK